MKFTENNNYIHIFKKENFSNINEIKISSNNNNKISLNLNEIVIFNKILNNFPYLNCIDKNEFKISLNKKIFEYKFLFKYKYYNNYDNNYVNNINNKNEIINQENQEKIFNKYLFNKIDFNLFKLLRNNNNEIETKNLFIEIYEQIKCYLNILNTKFNNNIYNNNNKNMLIFIEKLYQLFKFHNFVINIISKENDNIINKNYLIIRKKSILDKKFFRYLLTNKKKEYLNLFKKIKNN